MKVSNRLIELVNENSSKKLYNKDIAYAFTKYPEQQNLDALIQLLSYNFYGARFLAANALSEYWKSYECSMFQVCAEMYSVFILWISIDNIT